MRDDVVSEYASGPHYLQTALEGLGGADLDAARAEGKWTIREVVHHLADAEAIWSLGLKTALGNSGCTFDISWYPPDNLWAEPLDYARRPAAGAVELVRATRNHTAQLLKHMPDDAWERYVVFVVPGRGESLKCTVGWIVDWQTRHLNLHLEQIRETRRARGV